MQEFRPQGSNIIRRLEQASKQIEQRMREKSCRNVTQDEDGSELSLKRSLIRDTTVEYCNYRHYLSYVDYNVQHQLGSVIATEEKLRKATQSGQKNDANLPLERFPNTESIANALGDVAARTTREIAQTQGVFTDAFEAYGEFERNYASHILMVLIEDRYQLVREYLRDTMNPI